MAEVISVLDLDMSDYASYPVLHVQEYDEMTREVKIRLYEDRQKYALETGVLVHITGKKVATLDDITDIPDDPETEGLGISIQGRILSSDPAIIQFNLTQALLTSGIKKCKVVITTYENEEVVTRISSIPFYIKVENECAEEASGSGSGCAVGTLFSYQLFNNYMSLTSLADSEAEIKEWTQEFDTENAEREWVQVKTNIQFGFSLKNYIFDYVDKIECIFKPISVSSSHFIFANSLVSSGSAGIYPRLIVELQTAAMVFNVDNVSVTYIPDSGESIFDYFYKMIYDAGTITLYRGTTLNDISEQVFENTWTVVSTTNVNAAIRIFYGNNGWNETVSYSARWYGLKVWKDSVLIHNYVPYTYGAKDTIENMLCQMDTPVLSVGNDVNGPVV